MRSFGTRSGRKAQAGFSMVELLMAAFILSIGILGVTMLQIMSIKAARGGQSLTTAVHVADRVMDQVELEGRLTWLNNTDSNYTTPGALSDLQYLMAGDVATQTFDIHGEPTTVADDAFFTVNTTKAPIQATASGVTGAMTDVTVVVDFVDAVDAASTPITRTVTITRRIVHG